MTPQEAVQKMLDSGLTTTGISELLRSRGLTTAQSTVCRLAAGKIENPGYELGKAIVSLCDDLHKTKAKKKKVA